MPKRLRCHPLAHRSLQFYSGSSEISYSGVEELSFSLSTTQRPRFGTSESPMLLRIFKAFPPMQSFTLHGRDTPSLLLLTTTHMYIWDTPTLTKPGVVFQKMLSLTTRDEVVSTSSHNLQEYSFTQLHILGDSQFPLSSSLFTLKPRVETKENFFGWAFATCASGRI